MLKIKVSIIMAQRVLQYKIIDNKVIATSKRNSVSTLVSLVLQSEQYHPVAQTNLHKGLKCKIKIITSVS